MKNTLAENMLRFGVKNLSESDVKKINESALLTEAVIDLTKDPAAPAASKFFAASWAKNVPQPNYQMGQYYLKTTAPKTEESQIYRGKVLAFKSSTYGTVNLPTLPMVDSGFGGDYDWDSVSKRFLSLTYAINEPTAMAPLKANQYGDDINIRFNQIPLANLQAMYAASPKKATYDTFIAAFKTSKSPIIPFLKGNAKAFFGV